MKNSILILATLMLLGQRITAQTWQWVREDAAGPEAYGVATDPSGNGFLAGITTGTAGIGTFSNTGPGLAGVLGKFDDQGNPLWANFIPGLQAYNVACDAGGNSFLCGYFTGTIVAGGQTLTSMGGNDIFVAKYSPSGTLLWANSIGGLGTDISNCVNVDASGNVIVSGYVGVSTFWFGASPISNTTGSKYFVAKYTNTGTPLWAVCGASGNSISNYVSSDSGGDIYLTGYFSVTSAIGSGTYTAIGSNDLYLTKFSSAGLPLWTVVGGGTGSDLGYCVRVHPSGDVFVSGGYSSASFTLATSIFGNSGSNDVFLARFSNAGSLLWAIKGGGTGSEVGYSMAAHAGGVYMGGSLGTVPFIIGTATITPSGTSDNMFLCGIDNSGNVTYSQFINGGGDDVMALDMYNGCSLYLGGDILTPTLTLGAFTVIHATSEVFFIAKFNTGINSPTLNLAPSYTLCQGSTMTLSASGANTYTWTGGPNTNSYVISPATTSSYVIAGTSTAGCSTKSIVNVVVVPGSATLSAFSNTPFCNGNSATLSVTGANTSTWSTGPTTSSIVVSPTATTVYVVDGISTSGCYYSNSYTINMVPGSSVTAKASNTNICKGQTITLTASGANSYAWNTGPKQATISVSPTVTTTYAVTGTNTANGCITTTTVQVKVNNCAKINEAKEEMQLSIFPNPAPGEVQIKADKKLVGAKILVRNLKGELVYSDVLVNESARVNGLSPGVYFITIEQPGGSKLTRKVVVEAASPK